MSLFRRNEDSAPDAPPPEAAPRRIAPPPPPAAPGPERGPTGGMSMANIGKSIAISGDLSGEEDLVVEGKVDGKISLPNSQLTVGADGQVEAEVKAKSIVVIGRVAGNLQATERIEIQATGVVDGDVSAPKLIVAEGAVLNGSISMGGAPASSAAGASAAAGSGSAGGSASGAPDSGPSGPKPAPGEVRKAG